MILTRRMAWFFLVFAAMNEVVWRNFSTDTYVLWDTFGQMGVMFLFLMSNYRLIDRTWIGEKAVVLPCCGVFEMEAGKIKVWRDYFDMTTFIKAATG